mmetsp:Transcript_35811/g.102300  ORF Transcript_35811/g.102300 Transcript_35811/m.102300 type:complete len:211 (-) Transcript_35811:330-962(-)
MYSFPVPSSTMASTVRMSRPPSISAAASAQARQRSSTATSSMIADPVFVFHSPEMPTRRKARWWPPMRWIRRSTSPRMKGSAMQCSPGIICSTERKSLIWWWSLMSIFPAPAWAEPTLTTAGKVKPYMNDRCEEAKCPGTTGNTSLPRRLCSRCSWPCTTGRSQKSRIDCKEFTDGRSAKSRPFSKLRPSKLGVRTSFRTSTKSGCTVLG